MIPICLIFNLKNRHYKQPSTNAVDGVLASVYLWSMVYPHLQQIIHCYVTQNVEEPAT